MLQERDHETYSLAKNNGFTTICGHTPSFSGKIEKDDVKGFIRIDTACGHKNPTSKLALYCIDDKTVQYFRERSEVGEDQQNPQH